MTPFQRFFINGKLADFLLHFAIFVGGGSCLFFTFVWDVRFGLGVLVACVLYLDALDLSTHTAQACG